MNKHFFRNVGVKILSFLLVVALMAPNAVTPIVADTPLEPGGIAFTKTATITPGFVNTWDIEVNFRSRNHKKSSDIILIMDVSGSMNTNERLTKTKAAAIKFIDKLLTPTSTDTRIALVTYSSDANTISDFVGYSGAAGLKTKVNNLSANGGTNIQGGIRQARSVMAPSVADNKTMILLSDGEPTFSYALNLPVEDSYLAPFGTQGNKETIRGIPVSAYNTGRLAGNGNTGFRSNVYSNGDSSSFYYNHGNSALTEADVAKGTGMDAVIFTIALDLSGNAELLMKLLASTEGHAFTAATYDLDAIYNKIAGGIQNNTSDVKIHDQIGTGYELVPNTIAVTNGTQAVSGSNITWTLGDPTAEYFEGVLRYRIRAVDAILNVPGTPGGPYATNDRTHMTYKDNKGFARELDAVVPKVIPTFFSFKKVLLDDLQEEVNDGGYLFKVKTTGPHSFNREDNLKPGNIVRTVQIYPYGTYPVAEVSATKDGNPLDLNLYTTVTKINGAVANQFTLGDDSRGNVDVLVTNTDKRTSNLTGLKSVVDATGDQFAQAGEILSYTLTLKNTGAGRAKDVIIKDTLSDLLPHLDNAHTTTVKLYRLGETTPFATHTRAELIAGFKVNIGANTEIRAEFDVKIKDDFDGKAIPKLRNIATIYNSTPEVEIPTIFPDIHSSKTMSNATDTTINYVIPGDQISVVLRIENKGARGDTVNVKDDFAAMLPYLDNPGGASVDIYRNNTLSSTISGTDLMNGTDIAVGPKEVVELRFKLNVKKDIVVKDVITLKNIAMIGKDTPTTEIDLKAPVITGYKKGTEASNDGYVQSGEVVTYEIHVENTGNAKSRAIPIKDTLSEVVNYFVIPTDLPLQTTKGTYKLSDLMNGFNIFLEPGESFNIKFSLTAKDNLGTLINNEKILRNIAMINGEDHKVELPFGDRGVTGSKHVRGDVYEGIVFAGEYLNYEIKVWNTKDLDYKDVVVRDDLALILPYLQAHDDEVVTITSDKGQVIASSKVKDLKVGIKFDVAVGETVTLKFRVKTIDTLDKNDIAKLNNIVYINNQDYNASIPVGNKSFTVVKKVTSAHESGYAVPGHVLHYEVEVVNTGDAAFIDIPVQDDLAFIYSMVDDPRTNVVTVRHSDSATPALITLEDMMNGYTFSVQPGVTVTFLFNVKVKADLPFDSNNKMHNLVTVNEKDAVADILVRDVLLGIDKKVTDSNGDGLASSGETLNYQISAGNSGNLNAKDVIVKDTLSNLLPYIEDYATGTVTFTSNKNGTHNTYTIQDLINGIKLNLDAGEHITLDFKVTLKADAVAKLTEKQIDKLVNTALLNDVPVTEEIPVEDPSFILDKSVLDDNGDELAEAGEKLHYTIKVVNNSLVNADKVTVKDTLSELLPYINDPSAVVVHVLSDTQDENITMAQLQAGFTTKLKGDDTLLVTFTLTVRSDLADVLEANTRLTNTAMINDTPVEETIPTILPNISASKTMKNMTDTKVDYVMPGDTVRVTLQMKNIGDAKGDVVVEDTLADMMAYIQDPTSLMAKVTRNGVAAADVSVADIMAGDVEFTVLPSEEIIITFDLKVLDTIEVTEGMKLRNKAFIGGDIPEVEIPVKAPNVIGGKSATEASGDGYVQSGETISYTIWAENTGTGPARSVTILDDLVELMDYVHIDKSKVITTSKETITLGDLMFGIEIELGVGEKFTIQFDLVAKDDLREIIGEDKFLRNKAFINDTEYEVEIPFGDRGVDGRKLVRGEVYENMVFAGETLTYTIEVWNTKDLLFEDVLVKDTLSSILEYIEAHDDIVLDIVTTGSQTFGDYTVADLKAGLLLDVDVEEKITITFTVRTKADLTKEQVKTLNNTVSINNIDKDASIPLGVRSMSVEKNVSSAHESGYAVPGFDVNYEIIVTNTGEGEYVDITLTDTLDKILSMVDDPRTNKLTVQYTVGGVAQSPIEMSVEDLMDGYLFSLDVEVSVSFKFTVSVKDDLDVFEHKVMENTATVNDHEADANIMTRNTKFYIEKSVSDSNEDGYASSGEKLYYRIDVGNEGNLDAHDVIVKDTLEDLIPYIKDYKTDEVVFVSNVHGTHNTYTIQDLINGIELDIDADEHISLYFEVTLKDNAGELMMAAEKGLLVNVATINDIPGEGEIEFEDPNLASEKSVHDANEDGFAEADEELHYEIRVENSGRATADEVVIQDTLSELLPYIEDPSAVEVHVVGKYIDTIITMAQLQEGFTTHLLGGEVMRFSFTLRVRADLKDILDKDTALRNVAMINDVPTETEIPTKLPKITANKTVRDTNGDGLVQKGETLYYEIHVENVGEVNALNVQVKDDLKYLEGFVVVDMDQKLLLNGEEIPATIKDLMNGIKLNVEAGKTAKLGFSLRVNDSLNFEKLHVFENKATVDKLEVGTEIKNEVVIPKVDPPKELPQTGVGASQGYIGSGTLLLLGAYIIIRKGFFKKED